MKKSVSLKLIVFSFLLAANVTYSAPEFQAGSGTDSTVAGVNNLASGEGSSAFGYFNKASGGFSSAVGNFNKASGENSSVVGSQYKVTGEASGAFGVGNISGWNAGANEYNYDYINEGKNSYMFGNYNKIASGTENNFILGNNVSIGSGINNSVALGNNSTVSSSNEVSVGSATLKRKITNVADGDVSATSTDAVTGKQLYSGEGIDVNAWQNKLDVTKKDASNLSASDISAWKSKLGVGNSISNSATSTDAVNGRQLYNAMQNSNNTFKNEVNEKIDNVKNEVRNVGSLSAALAGLHPMQYDPKAPTQVMAALGHYKNKQAVAIGASYYFNDRFMMSTGIALSGEKRTETMANVGFTIKLGKGSGVAYNETPQYVVQNEVKRLTVENQELKEKVNAQGAENKDLKERVQKLEEKLNKLLTTK